MFALAGALIFLAPHGQDNFPDVPEFPFREFLNIVIAMEPDPNQRRLGGFRVREDLVVFKINVYLQQAETALDYLEDDKPRLSSEVPSRRAAESYDYLRRFVSNRVGLEKFARMPEVAHRSLYIGIEPMWWNTKMSEVTVRTIASRISDFMGATPATMKWARPEARRLLTALHQSPYPSVRRGDEDLKSNWEVAAEIHQCLFAARKALESVEGNDLKTLNKAQRHSLAEARAFARRKGSFDRLVRAFEWELALIDVDPQEALSEAQDISLRTLNLPTGAHRVSGRH